MTILKIIYLLALTIMLIVPSLKAFHMFQQNRYEFFRYTNWLKHNYLYLLKNRIIFILTAFILFILGMHNYIYSIMTALIYAIYAFKNEKKQKYVKPLVYTYRIKRQMAVYFLILIVILNILINSWPTPLVLIIALFLPEILIYLTALITMPIEKLIKKSYENKARQILAQMPDLTKIAITGSYGKTSTKNIIYDLLNEHYYTLMTPASYNTPMGITKTIREELKPMHEIFICEMGADHVGEIKYLMDFIKPQYGVVTSIGPQHLNTFKTLDNIIKEKMQVIEKLPKDGIGIINIDNKYIEEYQIKNNCRIIRVGIKNKKADLCAKDIKYSANGSSFKVNIKGEDYQFETVLLGENNVMNILLGIAIALDMNISPLECIKYVKNIKPIAHRLEKKIINGFHFIDNAFNSNPVSAKQSLDVLSFMPGKKIIVTPGLIDLGKEEYADNKEFGSYMKGRADEVVIVGNLEKDALLAGLIESNYPGDHIHYFKSMKEAFDYIYLNFSIDDTILIENDLPDAFLK